MDYLMPSTNRAFRLQVDGRGADTLARKAVHGRIESLQSGYLCQSAPVVR